MRSAFRGAMVKLASLGNDRNSLVDCSSVIPTPSCDHANPTLPGGKVAGDVEGSVRITLMYLQLVSYSDLCSVLPPLSPPCPLLLGQLLRSPPSTSESARKSLISNPSSSVLNLVFRLLLSFIGLSRLCLQPTDAHDYIRSHIEQWEARSLRSFTSNSQLHDNTEAELQGITIVGGDYKYIDRMWLVHDDSSSAVPLRPCRGYSSRRWW